jgi:2-methylcitrate dehydratase PrpD
MKRVAPELARWAAGVRWETIPMELQGLARLLWLDTFGCMLVGSTHPEAIALGTMLGERGREGRVSSAVGPTSRLSPWDAVLVNGLSTGVDVFDGGNTASQGHVAGYILPPVMTVAESTGASLAEAFAAFVVGYEVAARIGASQKIRTTMHKSGTWNVIGAAAAIAYLRGMSAEPLAHVMELAANLTLATSWDAAVHGANVRNLYHAMPGYIGLLVADLVPAGFRGGPRSIEVTFSPQLSSQEPFDEEGCVSKLGERWLIEKRYIKRYPVCHSFFAVLDALLEARAALPHPFDPQRDAVRVGTHSNPYKRNRGVHNESELAARESLPVNVAIGLIFGNFAPEIYRSGQYADPRILPLANRVVIEEAKPEFQGARPGWIEITQSGAPPVYRRIPLSFGDPENPHPFEVVREKFLANARPVLGESAPAVASEIVSGDLSRPLRDVLPEWLGFRSTGNA